MKRLLSIAKNHPALLLTLALFFALALHFFDTFPNGWDQAEYAWGLKSNFFPHSPYILYFFLGQTLDLLFSPPIALSLLSLASGCLAIGFFYAVNLRLAGSGAPVEALSPSSHRAFASCAAALLGLSFLFVIQSATQEIYVFQTFLSLVAFFLLITEMKIRVALSGFVFGLALASHNATAMLGPAALYLLIAQRPRPARALLIWLSAALLTYGFFFGLIVVLLPGAEDSSRLTQALRYARGIAPGIEPGVFLDPIFLVRSTKLQIHRIFAYVPTQGGLPHAAELHFNIVHLGFAAAGFCMAARLAPRIAGFWLAWCIPYLIYEVATVQPVDLGVYVLFLFPPLAALTAFPLALLDRYKGGSPEQPEGADGMAKRARLIVALRFLALLLLLLPSFLLIQRHWDDPKKNAVEHFSRFTLVSIWMAEHLPVDAVVIQPASDLDINRIGYYSGLTPIMNLNDRLYLFEPRGSFTPLNIDSYSELTTGLLNELLNSGRPVYAMAPAPLDGIMNPDLDAGAFEWSAAETAQLDPIVSGLALPDSTKRLLQGGEFQLYSGRPSR